MLDPTALLRQMFDAAVEAAQSSHCLPPHLPSAPQGRTIVIGAGKAWDHSALVRALELMANYEIGAPVPSDA